MHTQDGYRYRNLPLSLEGQVAIVTGVRRGMGSAIALTFAEAGADVAVCDIVVEGGEMEGVAEEIKKLGRRSLAVQTDVTQKAQVDNLVKRAEDELGPIDILVNTVGGDPVSSRLVRRPTGEGQPAYLSFFDCSEEDWDLLMDLNLKSCFLTCEAVGKKMVERKKGSIISIASDMGITGSSLMPLYSISKGGVIVLTKALASELRRYTIRVNCICPSGTVGTHAADRQPWRRDPEVVKQMAARMPFGWGQPSDIASAALFLASDASRHITGETILVDGGAILR